LVPSPLHPPGTENIAAGGTTSDGNYDDETHDIDGDYSNGSEQTGGQSISGTHTDKSKVDDVHDGTFDDSAGADDSSGTFNDGETDLTTDTGSQSGSYNGGTINESGYDGTLSIDSADGSETDTNGAVSDDGSLDDNTDEVDGGSVSHQTPLGPNGSHSDSASVADTDLSNADGPFTTSGGAIATEDINYGDHDKSKSNDSYSDTTTSGNAQGGTTTLSDSFNGTDKNKEDDTGERDQTASGTTDDGTDTDTDHGTANYSQQTTVTSPTTTASDGLTEGDVSDDFTTDNYDVTGTGRTDDDSFDNEDRPSGTLTNTYNYTAPGDPGTNISSSETDKSNSDDKDDGTEDQTNGSITSETDNFTDTTDGTDDTTYNAASDKGTAAALVTPFVPSLGYTRLIIQMGLYGEGTALAAAGYGGATTTTGSANSTSDDTENDLADGTTTDTNGTVNTDENFDDTDKSKDSANVSYTTTSVNPPSGNDYSANYSGSETDNGTDSNEGTIDGGVTKDDYNDTGTETDKITSSSTSDTSTSSGGTTTTVHGTTSYNGTDMQNATETGDYTTEPPGTNTAKTPDNPNGYAVSDQTIGYGQTMTSTRTQTYSGTVTGPGYSVTGNGDYTAKETLTINSNSTVNVNVAQNKDTQSGGYGSNATESQIADYNDSGTFTSPHVTEVFTFNNHQEHSGYNNDGGTYGGQDSDTQGSSSSGNQSATITETVFNYSGQGGSDTKTTSYGSSGGGASKPNTTNGPAPQPPVDPAAGDAPAARAAPDAAEFACFAAGTPVRTPTGWKAIEQLSPGDLVLASPDSDPESRAEPKLILRVYANPPDRLIGVHASGQLIRATMHHPFYVRGAGWTGASHLRPGDQLLSHDGNWLSVTETFDNGDLEPVYNLYVQDYHTYFLGKPNWGFSVLVHNQSGGGQKSARLDTVSLFYGSNGGLNIPFNGTGGPIRLVGIGGVMETDAEKSLVKSAILGPLRESINSKAGHSPVIGIGMHASATGDKNQNGTPKLTDPAEIAKQELDVLLKAKKPPDGQKFQVCLSVGAPARIRRSWWQTLWPICSRTTPNIARWTETFRSIWERSMQETQMTLSLEPRECCPRQRLSARTPKASSPVFGTSFSGST
jgi:hypothetical protein